MGLPTDTLKTIHADIIECSLAASMGGSYRAKPYELQKMADTVVKVARILKK